jgi:membrane protease YdiL (CAAX protease family)
VRLPTDQGLTRPGTVPRALAPWGLPDALAALAISAVIYVIPGSLFLILTKHWSAHHRLASEIASYGFLVAGVAISVAVLILARFPHGRQDLGFRFPGWEILLRSALAVVPIFIGIAVVYWLFSHLLPGFHLQGNAKEALPVGHKGVPLVEALGLILFAGVLLPIKEGTLFGGVVFQGVAHFFSRWLPQSIGVFLGTMVSGAVFGLAHLQPHTFPVLMFLGVCLAYIFYYAKSVYASALVHGLFNTIAVIAVVTNT